MPSHPEVFRNSLRRQSLHQQATDALQFLIHRANGRFDFAAQDTLFAGAFLLARSVITSLMLGRQLLRRPLGQSSGPPNSTATGTKPGKRSCWPPDLHQLPTAPSCHEDLPKEKIRSSICSTFKVLGR